MDSDRTPPGWLTICGRIGNGYAPGTCFEKKAPTGMVWRPGGSTNPARMLTRLIVLQGLEDGVNLHGDVDTFARGIYIHGTNVPAELGTPASHGCVRMDYQEVVELFDRVQVGDGLLVAGDPSA
jgi:UDP-N-acetylmuramate--alanine ligase